MFLDTSFCVDLLRTGNKEASVYARHKLKELGVTPLYISVFVLCELHAGIRVSDNYQRELSKLELFMENIGIVYPGETFAVAYGEAASLLNKKGQKIPVMDLLIGVLAKSHGMPLLTRDTTHFTNIPGLVIETYSPQVSGA
jgi:tRNA(fMet)-specific endonuclease VapC